MAKVYLEANDSFELSSDATIFGATGSETVLINGTPDITLDPNVERVELSGDVADYTFEITGTIITVYSGGSAVVTFTSLNQVTDLVFADGAAELSLTGLNTATLGGTAISTTAAAVVPAVIDDTDTSDTADGGTTPVEGQTFTLTTGADTIFGTTGNDTFTATDLTYNPTTDVIADSITTDSDTLNFTVTTDNTDLNLTGTIAGIENVNVNIQEFTNASFDLDINGVSSSAVNVDVTQAGSGINTIAVANAGSVTLGLSSDFTTTSVATKADADVIVNTAGATNAVTQTGTADTLVVNGTGATSTTVTAAAATDSVTLTTAGEAIVTAANSLSATSGELTIDSQKGALLTATTAKTVSITAKEDADITAAANATTVTVSSAGKATDTVVQVSTLAAAAATTMNLSGNGAGVEFELTGSNLVNTINISGSQDVIVEMSASDIDALTAGTGDIITVVDTLTAGTSTLRIGTAAGNVNATSADVDLIEVDVANATKTLTVASGANVQLKLSQTTSSSAADITAAAATAATNVLNLDINDNAAAVNTITLTDQVYSNFKTVNVSLTDNMTTATSVGFGTANVVFTGAGALTLAGATTAGSIDASAATGIVTASLAGLATVGTIKTGSAADAITVAAALTSGSYTIETGAGDDTINAIAASMVINGGTGTDTVAFAATADLSGLAFDLTSVEVVTIAAGSTVTVDSDEITGEAFVVNGANATTSILDVTLTQATVDLSNLVVGDALTANVIDGSAFTAVLGATVTGTNAADTINVNGGKASTANGGAGDDAITGGAEGDTLNGDAGVDTINGAAGNDIINGGTGNDIIDGGIGNDTITGGEGADTITVGAGNDTVILTETTAAIDDVIIGDSSAAANGVNTIVGFAAGDGIDTISIDKADTEGQTAGSADDVAAFASEATVLVTGGAAFVLASDTATKSIIEITTTLDDDITLSATSTGADLMQALSSDATAAASITVSNLSDIGFLLTYQNGNAYLWDYAEGSGDKALVAADISLVGVFEGIAAGGFASGDFILA